MVTDRISQTVTLPDERTLGFAEYGAHRGTPVIFFHGLPSCRLMHPSESVCSELNVRLVVPDRPGFGLSDPKPGRTLLDWSDDVSFLADRLGLETFGIAGSSGGAPFVAATAFCLGSRVTHAAIMSGSGPVDGPGAMKGIALERRIGYLLARRFPKMFRWVLARRGNPQEDVDKFFRMYTSHNPAPDQALFAQPEIRQMFLSTFTEATRRGLEAFAYDVELAARPWGFSLSDIAVPTSLWHGELDNITPLGMAEALERQIPNCTLRVIKGQGHLLFLTHWREILQDGLLR